MKKITLLLFLPLIIYAQSFKIEHLKTELYSKSSRNNLKKIELSLEFEGENLSLNQSKLYDATNIIISSFFYEDLFTELGKLRFKENLQAFLNKKYKLEISNIYLLTLRGVEKFELEELKDFLKTYNQESNVKQTQQKQTSTLLPELKVPEIQSEDLLLKDDLSVDDIDIKALNLPSFKDETLPKMLMLKDKNISLEQNASE